MARAAAGVQRERCVSSDARGGASGGAVGVARCLRNRAAEPNRETHPAHRPQTETKERGRPADSPRTARVASRSASVRAPAHGARAPRHARAERGSGARGATDRARAEPRTARTPQRARTALLDCGGENHPRTTHARRRPHPRPPPTASAVSAAAGAAAATCAPLARRRRRHCPRHSRASRRECRECRSAHSARRARRARALSPPRARPFDRPTDRPSDLFACASWLSNREIGEAAKCHKGGGGCEEAHTQRAAAARTNLRVPVVHRTCRQSAVTVVARLRRPRTCAHAGSQLYYERTLIDYVIIVTW